MKQWVANLDSFHKYIDYKSIIFIVTKNIHDKENVTLYHYFKM